MCSSFAKNEAELFLRTSLKRVSVGGKCGLMLEYSEMPERISGPLKQRYFVFH